MRSRSCRDQIRTDPTLTAFEDFPRDADIPYPQGGRLNRAVNLPSQYLAQAGSGLDRLKMEALSWGSTYRNLTNAQAAITFPVTAPASWPVDATAYLVPWFNGGCPWLMEYLSTSRPSISLICFWAFDHLCLFSWPVPLTSENSGKIFLQSIDKTKPYRFTVGRGLFIGILISSG